MIPCCGSQADRELPVLGSGTGHRVLIELVKLVVRATKTLRHTVNSGVDVALSHARGSLCAAHPMSDNLSVLVAATPGGMAADLLLTRRPGRRARTPYVTCCPSS